MMLRRAVLLFFLIFVFSSAFSIAVSQLSLAVSLVLFLVIAVTERFQPFVRELKWFWAAVALYLGWLVVVCLVQDDPLRALDHIREEWLFSVIPVGVYLLRDKKKFKAAVMTLAGGLLLISIASLAMYFLEMDYDFRTGFTPVVEGGNRPHGNFSNLLTFGNYATVASLFLLGYGMSSGARLTCWSRWLPLTAGLLGLVVMVLAGGRGPILASIGGLVLLSVMVWSRYRLAVPVLLAVMIVGGILTPGVRDRFAGELAQQFDSDWPASRLFIWKTSLEIVEEHPVTGAGPGNFASAYQERLGPDVYPARWYTHAHNDFVQAAARSGLPGLIMFGWLWFTLLQALWRRYRRCGIDSADRPGAVAALLGSLAFVACSLTEAAFADEEVRALLMIVWAVGLAGWYKAEESPPTNI